MFRQTNLTSSRGKNNVGRVLVYTEHGWLFGMVEDIPDGRLFLSMVEHRDKETLQAIIKNHVHRGTTIFTDSWKSYIGLSHHGFQHFMVNHKKNFVSHQRMDSEPEDGGDEETEEVYLDTDVAEDAEDETLIDDTIIVHTNKIERVWREVKKGLRHQPLSLLRRNINVEMFRYNHLQEHKYFSERRRVVLSVIAKHSPTLKC